MRRGYAADADDASGASGAKKTGRLLFDSGERGDVDGLGELDRNLGRAHGDGGSTIHELLDLVRDNHSSKAFGPISVMIAYMRLQGFLTRGSSKDRIGKHRAHPAFALLGEATVRFAPVMDASAVSKSIFVSGRMAIRGVPVHVHGVQALSAEVVRVAPQMSGTELTHTLGGWQNLAERKGLLVPPAAFEAGRCRLDR